MTVRKFGGEKSLFLELKLLPGQLELIGFRPRVCSYYTIIRQDVFISKNRYLDHIIHDF